MDGRGHKRENNLNKGVSAVLAATLSALLLASCGSSGNDSASKDQPPNILFVVLDDLGVDQLSVFGYGGIQEEGRPKTPTIDTLAMAGVRFRNAWSMPTCTPSRATFFSGRYPFRTDVKNAIVSTDLANSQVSPFEITTPKLLKQKGYTNALIGKMHLAGSDQNPDNNPLGNGAMHELGWDYFAGYMDGGPYPIDQTAGGANHHNGATYGCGFVPTLAADPANGADSGACYQADGSCTSVSTLNADVPGLACVASGGLFDPGQSCQPSVPAYLNFAKQNGYYTSELIINHPDGKVEVMPPENPRGRQYRTILETDLAVEWVKQQPADKPWMLSVGYSAIHTPLQPPPTSLLPEAAAQIGAYTCGVTTDDSSGTMEQRQLTTHMLEALDKEIGRLLVETGLAKYKSDGSLDYRPQETNTVVVVMGDNGTYGPSVKFPFNPVRAKGFPYQTGVWVPLIVAGPMVQDPGREIEHMVNSADMYSLFSELAGLDLKEALPESRQVDAEPVLPYLTDPGRESIRGFNYTEMGTNISASTAPPCVIPLYNVCVQIFPEKQVCEDQSGVWYGPGSSANPEGFGSCCAVNEYLGDDAVDIMPDSQKALRNEFYKLVRLDRMNCTSGQLESSDELYAVNQNVPLPKLDNGPSNLLPPGPHWTPEIQQNYDTLKTTLDTLLASRIDCPGDGNLDLVVDEEDVRNWTRFSTQNGGHSSWYDFNHDGLTNDADLEIITQNMGRDCRPT